MLSDRNDRLANVEKLQRELDVLESTLADRKKTSLYYYNEITDENNKSAINDIGIIADHIPTNKFETSICNYATKAKQAFDNSNSPNDIQALYDFKMFTSMLADKCVSVDESQISSNLIAAVKAIPKYDLVRNNSYLPEKSEMERLESKIEDKTLELRDEKLKCYIRTELIQESLDDINKKRFALNELNLSQVFTDHALGAKKIPGSVDGSVSDPIYFSKNGCTYLERVDISLNESKTLDAIIVTEYTQTIDVNKNKTYQLISDRIIILNPAAKNIFLDLDSDLKIEKNYGKSLEEINDELDNEKLLKQFIYDLDTLSNKKNLIWKDTNEILDPTILLAKANQLADSSHHHDWTLLANSLQGFIDFIHSKTDADRSDKQEVVRKKWEVENKKNLNTSEEEKVQKRNEQRAEVDSVEDKYDPYTMRMAGEFETTFDFNILKTTLLEIENKSCEQEFKIACANLKKAIQDQENSDDPILKELGATGRRSLNLAKDYVEKYKDEIKGKDLQQYTNWVNKITKVVSNPTNHQQAFTQAEMKLGNDSRAGEIFLGLTCIALGLATIAASVAFAVMTCGFGSGLSIGGFAVGSSLATTGSVMLGFKIGAIAMGVAGGVAGAGLATFGANLTFFDNKGRFGNAVDDMTAKAQAVRPR